LAVLQVLNLAYNAASLAAWVFYSGMCTYSEAALMQHLHASELASQLGQ